MKTVLRSCVLAFLLGLDVTIAIIHEIIQEKNPVRLKCPHPVEGDVTWSRERDGNKEDILTVHGDTETKHINDPKRRYNHEGFTSLYITRVNISDTGQYFCNDEAAVDLTVVPSGAVVYNAAEMDTVTLNCSTGVGGSDNPTWSKDAQEIKQGGRLLISSLHRTLKIKKVQPADSGLYYCDGKPAAYLRVTKGDQSDRGKKKESTTTTTLPTPPTTTTVPTTTTTVPTTTGPATVKPVASSTLTEGKRTTPSLTMTTSLQAESGAPYLWQMKVRLGIVFLYLVVMISITVTTWMKALHIEKRRSRKREESATC